MYNKFVSSTRNFFFHTKVADLNGICSLFYAPKELINCTMGRSLRDLIKFGFRLISCNKLQWTDTSQNEIWSTAFVPNTTEIR
jgi:hypothetical protein